MPVPLRTNNLKVEAKFNVVTEFPNFDLHAAAAAGNIGLVEYALSRGQPVNSVLDGVLPLHAACAGGDEQVVKLLIDHGADVNAPRLPRKYSSGGTRDASAPIVGTSGSTPLHFAAANGNKNIVLTLLLRGAHPDRADKHGVTPELLARQYKWIECAELLQNWVEKRDRDLRERQNPVDDPAALGSESETGTSRRRIQVKRSIDTALNMLKASSAEAYLRPPGSSSCQTPPASPSRADYPPTGTPSDDGRFTPSPSPIDLAMRRPSLPHVLYPPSRTQKPATLTKPNAPSPRRPRSAGNGADRDDGNHATYGRGGAGRLGSKYSLMNLFKKAGENESMTSHQTSSSVSISISPSSSNRARTPSTSQGQVPPFYSKASSSQDYSPSHPPMPLAVDLHNALAQRQTTRDRSGSSGSRIDLPTGISADDSVSFGSPGSVSGSPLTRFGLLRRGPSGHFRDRSGSGASLGGFSAHRSGGVFDEDVVGDVSGKTKPSRPGILRGHHRSTSFGQNQPNSRNLRFDASGGSQSRFKDPMTDRVPESAPATVADFGPHGNIMEEDDEYGRPLQRTESHSAVLLSNADDISSDFPFSLDRPPLSVDDNDSPVTIKNVPPMDYRGRGDSISSNSTADSLFNPPQLSASETTSAGSGTVTTPVGEFSSFQSSPKDSSKRLQLEESQVERKEGPNTSVGVRRGNTALDIDINLIESHAEAEALVQRAQQDILDLHPDSLSPEAASGDGWIPLSARLAAYGESLALEKKLRQQKEEQAGNILSSPFQSPAVDASLSSPSRTRNGVNRQCSLEHKSNTRVKAPKRPHTSSGTSSCDTPAGSTSTSDVDTPSRSAPVEKHHDRLVVQHIAVARSRTPEPDERLSRVSSLDGIDTDSDFGGPLTRVSTAPMLSSVKGRRDPTKTAAKLTRMGFPNDLTPRTATPATTSKRFGSGLKSLMQSFKGKP